MFTKKSQSSIEFLLIFITALFFLTSFIVVINESRTDKEKEKEPRLVQQVALTVQDEINLAERATDGYLRNFTLPLTLNGGEYSINITGSYIYVTTQRNSISLIISAVEGNITKGNNFIKKENGKVYLNK
jgi:uncharacterized protein (UPF0333 family)